MSTRPSPRPAAKTRRRAPRTPAPRARGGPAPPDVDPPLTATRSYDPPATYSNACIACVVEVDVETGQVRVERLVAVEDCGTVINPLLDRKSVVEGKSVDL